MNIPKQISEAANLIGTNMIFMPKNSMAGFGDKRSNKYEGT